MCQIDYCINRIIDFKEAEVQNTFVVKLGVDEDLDKCECRIGGQVPSPADSSSIFTP
jgi:hypothetical protein